MSAGQADGSGITFMITLQAVHQHWRSDRLPADEVTLLPFVSFCGNQPDGYALHDRRAAQHQPPRHHPHPHSVGGSVTAHPPARWIIARDIAKGSDCYTANKYGWQKRQVDEHPSRGHGVVLQGLWILLLLALASYDARKASDWASAGHETLNYIRPVAWAAWVVFRLFGLAGFVLPALLAVWGC